LNAYDSLSLHDALPIFSKIEHSETYRRFYWNPVNKELDVACFNGVDAIIHLAGATISKRWTPDYKNEILNSRVESTQLLIDSLKDRKSTRLNSSHVKIS